MQARLSERLDVLQPVMMTLINELEAMCLVQRRPHPSDRRAVECTCWTRALSAFGRLSSSANERPPRGC